MQNRSFLAFSLVVLIASAAGASDLTSIQDNSFLIEEAYNQEAGVVQHISFFMRDRESGNWVYTFTQEWPVVSQKHQLSYTMPIESATGRGIGDALINYRYQLRGTGDSALAIAPRVSLVLPTGNDARGRGRGSTGVQVNLPLSRVLGERVVGHSNAGAAWTSRSNDVDLFAGQSFIYALNSRVHLMAEATWSRTETRGAAETEVLVSPGVRWAHNFSSGLQIVPGIAFPIGVGPSSGSRSAVLYVSFEHPFLSQ